MSDKEAKETVGRLRAELAQVQIKLADARTENDDLISRYRNDMDAIHDALNIGLTEETNPWAAVKMIRNLRAELAQAHEELAAADGALGEFYCPVLDPETDEPCGSYWKDRGVNVMRQSLDHAKAKLADARAAQDALARECIELQDELNHTRQDAQDRRDEVQELRLSPCEAEGLRRQLAETRQELKQRQRQIDLLSNTVKIERQSRQKAQWWAAQYAENLDQERDAVREALDKYQIPRAHDDGNEAATRTRIFWLNQRAERAEALAALVTVEVAGLLEGLAYLVRAHAHGHQVRVEQARVLAAEIREMLDER